MCRVPGAYLRHAPVGVSMKPCGHDHDELNHLSRPHHLVGSCRSRAASWPCPTSRRVGGEATDLAVAQAVVDEREEMTRRGDTSDVAAPAGTDAGLHRGDLRVADRTGDRFDGGPAQQPGALLICGPGGGQGAVAGVQMSRRRVRTRAVSRGEEGGQGRAGGPPEGGSLDGPVDRREHNESREPRQGFLRADCSSCRTSFRERVLVRRMRASLLISALGVGDGVGCKMAFGVSRRTWCGRSFLVGCPAGAGSNRVAGSWSQIIDWWTPARPPIGWRSSGGGREGGVAGVAQRVVAAAGELAGDGDQGDVGLEALTELPVVGVVGRARPGRVDGGLIQRPAQHRRPLLGQMAAGAFAVRGPHGDVQAGMADGVVGAGEATTVAELFPDGHGEQWADPVVLLQATAAGLVGARWRRSGGAAAASPRSAVRPGASRRRRRSARRAAGTPRPADHGPRSVTRLAPTAGTP